MRNKVGAAIAAIACALLAAGCGSGDDSKAAPETVTVTSAPAATSGAMTQQDLTFLSQVAALPETSNVLRSDKIYIAHKVCTAEENGQKMDALKILIQDYGVDSGTKFMHAAVSVYCPQYLTDG